MLDNFKKIMLSLCIFVSTFSVYTYACNHPGCESRQVAGWCAKCRAVNYCSSEHQKADWKRHKKEECSLSDIEQAHQILSSIARDGFQPSRRAEVLSADGVLERGMRFFNVALIPHRPEEILDKTVEFLVESDHSGVNAILMERADGTAPRNMQQELTRRISTGVVFILKESPTFHPVVVNGDYLALDANVFQNDIGLLMDFAGSLFSSLGRREMVVFESNGALPSPSDDLLMTMTSSRLISNQRFVTELKLKGSFPSAENIHAIIVPSALESLVREIFPHTTLLVAPTLARVDWYVPGTVFGYSWTGHDKKHQISFNNIPNFSKPLREYLSEQPAGTLIYTHATRLAR